MEFNLTLAALLTATAALGAIALIKPQETYKWIQQKIYRYNVTLALYMLTPTERFIFSMLLLFPLSSSSSANMLIEIADSILFLSLTLLTIAACLYLPEHISIIARRVAWYCFGNGAEEERGTVVPIARDVSSLVGVAKQTAGAIVEAVGRKSSGEAVREMLSGH